MKRFRLFWASLAALLACAALSPAAGLPEQQPEKVALDFFWAENCPHCLEAKPFLEELARRYPQLQLRQYEVWNEPGNYRLMLATAEALGHEQVMTPMTVLGDRAWFGFDDGAGAEIEAAVRARLEQGGRGPKGKPDERISLPLLGDLNASEVSLPVVAVTLGLLDSFNPCAFFVLFFLLSLLVHAHSRRTMLLVGGTFVLFSGLLYFLFMAAWLNLFFLIGHLRLVTVAAGLLALLFALVNIKDFFLFRSGVSLSIPESAKPGLYRRMRSLVRSSRLPTVLAGTLFLALTANSYELLCTAGFPMVFTRILTLHQLPPLAYYGLLALYNLVYILPLAIIVGFSIWTLGSHKLSEWQGRVLKLLSGCMMLAMGAVLLTDPGLLTDLPTAGALLAGAIGATAAIALLWRLLERTRGAR